MSKLTLESTFGTYDLFYICKELEFDISRIKRVIAAFGTGYDFWSGTFIIETYEGELYKLTGEYFEAWTLHPLKEVFSLIPVTEDYIKALRFAKYQVIKAFGDRLYLQIVFDLPAWYLNEAKANMKEVNREK